MKTVIEIQDEYIAAMLNVNGQGYALKQSKQSRKLMNAVMDLGLSQREAEQALYAAVDVVTLMRKVAA